MSKSVLTVFTSAVIAGLTAFGVVKACTPNMAGTQTIVSQDGSVYRTVNLTDTDYPDLTYAAESAVDAVVFVKVTVKTQGYVLDPFSFFFGGGGQLQERQQQGSGSGVIIRPDGYIVTNNHVVANATEIQVTLNNNKTFPAEVIGRDPATDVALIKIDAEGLPTIQLGDSDNLRLGEWVLAIGSPMGEELRGTITAGIVSAKGRSMPSQNSEEFKIESFIQTDAAVNPGNSGGALVNKSGELVGINTAIVSTTGSYTGYSFAIPVNIVKKIVGDLIDFGSVQRVQLGVRMGTVNDEIAKELKLSSPKGVYISEVIKGSAAEKAGLKEKDVLIAVDGAEIATGPALQEKVNSYRPGDVATLTVIREGKEKELEVTFEASEMKTGTVDSDGSIAFYGSKIKTAEKDELSARGLKAGVEIVSVGQGKLLDAGATEGFIILYVNEQAVSTAEEVVEIAKKSRRTVVIEGVTASGRSSYFAFGKDE